MKWNKYYNYVIVLNCFLFLLVGAGDPIIIGLYPAIGMLIVNGIFAALCKGSQRVFAGCFTIVGVVLSAYLIYSQMNSNHRMDQIRKVINNYAQTNKAALSPATN